jgi:hypothetical protein
MGVDGAVATNLRDELRGDGCGLGICDTPPHDAATPNIHYQIQMQVPTAQGRR